MSASGLKEAVAALNRISRFAVTTAKMQAVNKVAKSVASNGLRDAAKAINVGDNDHQGIPVRVIRSRAHVNLGSMAKPKATIFVNCQPLPVIKLMSTPPSSPMRGKPGKALKIGPYHFRNGFIAQAPNGYWQAFERTGRARNPIRVIKVSVVHTLTRKMTEQTLSQMREKMPKELEAALNHQLEVLKIR